MARLHRERWCLLLLVGLLGPGCPADDDDTTGDDDVVVDDDTGDDDAGDDDATASPVAFEQLDFTLQGQTSPDTGWGRMKLTFDGEYAVQYLNLVADGVWVLQNVPVLSSEGPGHKQTTTYTFDLGVATGTPVEELEVAWTLTGALATEAPEDVWTAVVDDGEVIFSPGVEEPARGGQVPPDPPPPLVGGPPSGAAFHGVSFPNQDCGHNECCPAAVSNSLQFLRDQYELDLDDEEISIDAMKQATDWDDGCKPDHWEIQKDAALIGKGIGTRKFTDIAEVIPAIEAGEDVELILRGHAVDIIGASTMQDGRMFLEFVDDQWQDKPGGTFTGTMIYDPATGLCSGGTLTHARALVYFVAEYPVGPDMGSLHGTVVDQPTSDALPKAAVELVAADGVTTYPVTAGADGRYWIPGIPDGTYTVTAVATGYQPYWGEIVVEGGTELVIEMVLKG